MNLSISIPLAQLAGWGSKTLLHRSGETITGRVLLTLSPDALKKLSQGSNKKGEKFKIIAVSGSNGKTSTARAVTQLISSAGFTVESNSTGSNLEWGVASTLMRAGKTHPDFIVLEVDELHLTPVLNSVHCEYVLMLNLSRDQLHRMHEVKRVANRWRSIVENNPETTFIGEIDDPFINYILNHATKKIAVSTGGHPHPDGSICPESGEYLDWNNNNYQCNCGLSNKNYDLLIPAHNGVERNKALIEVLSKRYQLPFNQLDTSLLARKVVKEIDKKQVNLKLAKNPASWREVLNSITSPEVILILNAREVDGYDTSWIWDISYETLRGKKVFVIGERGLDLYYRLHVEGIAAQHSANFNDALNLCSGEKEIEVIAAYTAYFELAEL